MKIVLILALLIHGLLHLPGFVKAFQLAPVKQLQHQDINKFEGLLWLLAALLFTGSALLQQHSWWWIPALLALLVSQVLIFTCWHEARYGSFINLLLLIPVVLAYGSWQFRQSALQEIEQMFASNTNGPQELLTENKLQALPPCVQKWLRQSGATGHPIPHSVRLKQEGLMRSSPEQKEWMSNQAEQYFTLHEPAFIWLTRMQMNPFIYLTGKDRSIKGKGDMEIKVLSLYPFIHEHDDKISEGALIRFLAEICWFPAAAVHPLIHWEETDSSSARASMELNGTRASCVFHFHADGSIRQISARRYMGAGANARQLDWLVNVTEHARLQGVQVPVQMTVHWTLPAGDFCWYKIKVSDLEYNKPYPYSY